ncbi:2169_t:CDS:2, partial [Funneliformis geosporum]
KNLIDEDDNLPIDVLPFPVDNESENLIDNRSYNLLTCLEEELNNEIINDFLYMDNIYDNVYDSEEQFLEIDSQHTKAAKKRLATEYRLTPQDLYHSMAEKARTLLEVTFSILNVIGEKAFIEHWKNIEKPSH